jgi:uncharacterized protein YndB with AHSA1/START domain
MQELISDEIIYETFIRSTPEQVYAALATSHGLDAWFTTDASVDPRPGGYIHFKWVDWGPEKISAEDGGLVIAASPPEKFVFQWQPDNPTYFTTVEINILPREGGSIVKLREYGYQNTPTGLRSMLNCACGWGEALTLMKFYLEHGLSY